MLRRRREREEDDLTMDYFPAWWLPFGPRYQWCRSHGKFRHLLVPSRWYAVTKLDLTLSASDQTLPIVTSMGEHTTNSYFRSRLVSRSTADKSNAQNATCTRGPSRGLVGYASPKHSCCQLWFSRKVGMINRLVELVHAWVPVNGRKSVNWKRRLAWNGGTCRHSVVENSIPSHNPTVMWNNVGTTP